MKVYLLQLLVVGRGAEMAGEIANSIFKPFFTGRDPFIVNNIGMSIELQIDGGTMRLFIVTGPFDINCWLLSSMQAGQPLYKYLGAYRDKVPIYAALSFRFSEAYAKEALKYKKEV